jgi:hypothetical protein
LINGSNWDTDAVRKLLGRLYFRDSVSFLTVSGMFRVILDLFCRSMDESPSSLYGAINRSLRCLSPRLFRKFVKTFELVLTSIYLLQSAIERLSNCQGCVVYRVLPNGDSSVAVLYESMVGSVIVLHDCVLGYTDLAVVARDFIRSGDELLFEIALHPMRRRWQSRTVIRGRLC